mmetsp:Transcript_118566/g.330800  ORF Transcript_118566/g.330800 Transcript_118566/m.330800 type:complete len:282 (-) Transcript_118566:117-962(-)
MQAQQLVGRPGPGGGRRRAAGRCGPGAPRRADAHPVLRQRARCELAHAHEAAREAPVGTGHPPEEKGRPGPEQVVRHEDGPRRQQPRALFERGEVDVVLGAPAVHEDSPEQGSTLPTARAPRCKAWQQTAAVACVHVHPALQTSEAEDAPGHGHVHWIDLQRGDAGLGERHGHPCGRVAAIGADLQQRAAGWRAPQGSKEHLRLRSPSGLPPPVRRGEHLFVEAVHGQAHRRGISRAREVEHMPQQAELFGVGAVDVEPCELARRRGRQGPALPGKERAAQ